MIQFYFPALSCSGSCALCSGRQKACSEVGVSHLHTAARAQPGEEQVGYRQQKEPLRNVCLLSPWKSTNLEGSINPAGLSAAHVRQRLQK